ncbi:hypothetical protein ACHAXT_004270 [Thalassiosira profunda]
MRLFDSHCHVHLGPQGVSALLQSLPPPLPLAENASPSSSGDASTPFAFAGAAVMSTHPRDYPAVDSAVAALRENSYRAVPCYGIHPWFLHEVVLPSQSDGDGSTDGGSSGSDDGEWLAELRQRLIDNPDAIVGEIGLDGARWREVETDGNSEHESIWDRERVLSCPMDLQQHAFEEQLLLAAELGRPASIHVVRAWGELFDSLNVVRERMQQRYLTTDERKGEALNDRRLSKREKKEKKKRRKLLPPKLYFHAFSGKAGVIPSLLAACEEGNVLREDVYFGFPPVIPNFYAPKTPAVMQKIGIDQLVLETDLENGANAWNDMVRGMEGVADALNMDADEVAGRTHCNAERLYGGQLP